MCNLMFQSRAVLLLLACLMAACTPTYNWREMPAADGAVQVAFPARPQTQTRELPVGDTRLPFTLTAATVGDAVFAVGHLVLPEGADAATRERYRQALEDSLARNLQATETARRDVQIRAAGHGGRASTAAHELELRGAPQGMPAWMLARVVVSGNRLIEIAAVGPADALSEDVARTFIDSVRMQ